MTEAPLRLIKIPTTRGSLTVDLHSLVAIEHDEEDNGANLVFTGTAVFGYFKDDTTLVRLQELWVDWTNQFPQLDLTPVKDESENTDRILLCASPLDTEQ